MAGRFIVLATAACVMLSAEPDASRAQSDQQEFKLVTPPLSTFREQIRPSADTLPVPTGLSGSRSCTAIAFSMGKPRTGSAASPRQRWEGYTKWERPDRRYVRLERRQRQRAEADDPAQHGGSPGNGWRLEASGC